MKDFKICKIIGNLKIKWVEKECTLYQRVMIRTILETKYHFLIFLQFSKLLKKKSFWQFLNSSHYFIICHENPKKILSIECSKNEIGYLKNGARRVQHKLYKLPDTGHTNISLYALKGLEIHNVGICDVVNNLFLYWKHVESCKIMDFLIWSFGSKKKGIFFRVGRCT